MNSFRSLALVCSVLALALGCEDPATMEPADAGLSDPDPDAGMPEPDAGPEVDPAIAEICAGMPGFEEACNVEQELVTIHATATPAFEDLFPGVTQFNMNGWEWWQQWPGGLNPTFEYDEASPAGIVCSVASALRFAAVMHTPPEGIVELLAETTWEGRFYNWNDDFSMPTSDGDGSGAELWAWQDYLIKWISQTNRDGTCYLPTRQMLVDAAANCLAVGNGAAGDITGCTN